MRLAAVKLSLIASHIIAFDIFFPHFSPFPLMGHFYSLSRSLAVFTYS